VLESCNAPLIVKLAAPPVVCVAHTPSGSFATTLDVTAVHPITAGTDDKVALVLNPSSDICLPFVNTDVGILPKSTTIVFPLLEINVPVTPVAVEAVAAVVLSVRVSPTVKFESELTLKL